MFGEILARNMAVLYLSRLITVNKPIPIICLLQGRRGSDLPKVVGDLTLGLSDPSPTLTRLALIPYKAA